MRYVLIVIGSVIALSAIAYFVSSGLKDKKEKAGFREDLNYYEGVVRPCAVNPTFPEKYGMSPPYLIDLRQKGYRGVRLLEYKEDGLALHLPGWDAYGWLGLYTTDRLGNVFITPVPHESIAHNPIGQQNRVLKLDHLTGELLPFTTLPQKKPSNATNPFGAMGIHFDCDNGSLYVSSVAGSGIREELGSIFQLDAQTGELISELEWVDAIGLGTYNHREGKRLYYGLARKSEIRSVLLDKEGKFTDDIRFEFSLIDQPGGSDDRAHKISFLGNRMELRANAFHFTLAAASDPMVNIYTFELDVPTQKWHFIRVRSEKQ